MLSSASYAGIYASNYFCVGYMKPGFSSLSLQLIAMRFQRNTSSILNIGSAALSYFHF